MGAIILPAYADVAPPQWCERYVGLPYRMGARGPDAFDCWGLNWLVLAEQFGITAPEAYGVEWDKRDRDSRVAAAGAIMREADLHFDEVEPGKEHPSDIIVLRIGGHPLHCGVVVTPGWMLHAAEDADTALERYNGTVWRNRVAGFWRVRR
jgi:cell wall-associated NlpC family hydrolase